ncbi:MAG: hypothetical protein V4582_15410 [Pseudomonadota bacterium]
MTIFGLSIHILIAIFFAIHAVRAGRELYWLIILFSFPLLGSVVYFFVVFLPQSRLEHGLRKAGAVVQKSLDPGRALREAQQAFDLTPTAHNQVCLANAMYDAGRVAEAVAQFDACLRGPFANDPDISLAAAQAKLANTQAQQAIELLEAVRQRVPNFRPEQLGLLLAKCYGAAGRQAEAGEQFAAIAARFGSVEVRAEYAIWAIEQGKTQIAEHELTELDHTRKHMKKHARSLHQGLLKRVDLARAQLRRAA